MRRHPFYLAGELISSDTVSALERLTLQAHQNELVGSILIPLYKDKIYFPITTGWASDNHTFTVGILDVCMDLIRVQAIRQSVPDTK